MTVQTSGTHVVIDDGSISNPLDLARRPYDGAAGDVRKFTFAEALTAAEERASKTGVRQVLSTQDVALADAHIIPKYLVQAI